MGVRAAHHAREDLARPVDIVAQPTQGRRKQLLVADMESTIIENEMLDELATVCGIGEAIADITARAMAGELDFEGAIKERVAMLKWLSEGALENSLGTIRITSGAATLVATMRGSSACTRSTQSPDPINASRTMNHLAARFCNLTSAVLV